MEEKDEMVTRDLFGLTVWGRTTTGQSISIDCVICDIFDALNPEWGNFSLTTEEAREELTDNCAHAVGNEFEKLTGRNPVTDLMDVSATRYLIDCLNDYIVAVASNNRTN